MTSYKEQVAEQKDAERQNKKAKLENRIEQIMKHLDSYLSMSGNIAFFNQDEAQESLLKKRVRRFLAKEYSYIRYKPYVNRDAVQILPEFCIHATNNPEEFAHYLDTDKSKEMKCTDTGWGGSSSFAYQQYQWDTLVNQNVKFLNEGAKFLDEVDFKTDEAYLLFGRKNCWEETHYRKEAFEKEGEKLVKGYSKSTIKWDVEKKEFLLLLYIPAQQNANLFVTTNTIEQVVENLTAQLKKSSKQKTGLFARLFGA